MRLNLEKQELRAKIVADYCFGPFLEPILDSDLEVGFSWVEVGGCVDAICFIVFADYPQEAPDEATRGSADRENKNDPAV